MDVEYLNLWIFFMLGCSDFSCHPLAMFSSSYKIVTTQLYNRTFNQ
jgi:hypothetical protein